MLKKHLKNGTPSAVKSASHPTSNCIDKYKSRYLTQRQEGDLPMKGTGPISGKVETLILRSRLGNKGIGVLELVGPKMTERSCENDRTGSTMS